MSHGSARFFGLMVFIVGLLCCLEAVARLQAEGLAAISHRALFKLALLKAKGKVDFVVLGSSRSSDGVNPALMNFGRGFSAATPAASLPSLEFISQQLGPQRWVLVELSKPQSGPAEFDGLGAPVSTPMAGDPVGAWLLQHSALLRVRRAFAFENWQRVWALLMPSRYDGSEWFQTQSARQTFRSSAPPEGVVDQHDWVPTASLGPEATLDEDGARVVAGYVRVVEGLQAQGAKVVLVGPPVAKLFRVEECEPGLNALRTEVGRRTRVPLLDFTCAPVDDRWFIDGQHLSAAGRTRYSQALGDALRALP